MTREDLIHLNALRVEALYDHSVIPVAISLIGSTVLCIALWDAKIAVAASSWLVILYIVYIIRYLTVTRYHATIKRPEDYTYWLNIFLIGALCSGTMLGSAVYIFIVDDDIFNIGILTMFLLILISGSTGIYSVYQRIYYAFTLPIIVPLIIFMLYKNNDLIHKLCMITTAFTVCIFVVQFHAHRMIYQVLIIKLDNKNLLNGYELDQDRIKIMERLHESSTIQLETAKNALRRCQEILENQ